VGCCSDRICDQTWRPGAARKLGVLALLGRLLLIVTAMTITATCGQQATNERE